MPNQRGSDQKVTSLSMSADLLAQVQARAAADGVSKGEVMRRAIRAHVDPRCADCGAASDLVWTRLLTSADCWLCADGAACRVRVKLRRHPARSEAVR